jgi:hypothetical protein
MMKRPIEIWTRYDDHTWDRCVIRHKPLWRSAILMWFASKVARLDAFLWRRMWG